MSTQTNWTKTVFFKTSKGQEELDNRQHGLRPKARQLLIMLDGERPLHTLTNIMAADELHSLVLELKATGFISHEASSVSFPEPVQAIIPTVAPKPASTPLDLVKLTRVKAYLIETSQQHLGLMAAKLQQEIAQVHDEATLRSALSHWNMAMRESRSGMAMASEYLQEARNIIGWSIT